MVLTPPELVALLQKEVRLLLHLAAKVDAAALDYRPTPKQRSTIELLRYLTMMGPGLVRHAKGAAMDPAEMAAAIEASNRRSLNETLAALAAHSDAYAELLADVTDADLRGEITWLDGSTVSRGQG